MHIMMLTDSMDVGGAETHVYELSRLLVLRGHKVTVVSSGGAMVRKLGAVGVRHIFLPNSVSPAAEAALIAILRQEKPHVIHAHTRRRAFLCRFARRYVTIPVVFTAHALFDARAPLDRLSYFPPDVIAVSRDIAAHLIHRFGVSRSAVTVIENGVDTSRSLTDMRQSAPLSILSVSRQDRDSARAAMLLCEIVPRLSRRLGIPVELTVVGGGNALPILRQLAEKANALCRRRVVRLVGRVDDPTPYLVRCHVFVGVSRAAMEAMAAARPVILCGDEGYLGILNSRTLPNALRTNLCARGEAAADEARLLTDLTAFASLSMQEREGLGKFARETALRFFSADRMAKRTEAVYRQAIARLRQSLSYDALICGYYGYGNCGDELILRHLLQGQMERGGESRLAIMTADGHAPSGTVGVARYDMADVRSALRRSGALILGGGSLLQDATSKRSLLYYLALIAAARRRGIPIMLYANGLGPLSSSSLSLCRRVLACVDVISLRDRESYRTVLAMGLRRSKVSLGADPVLAYAKEDVRPPVRQKRIAVFPHGTRARKERERLAESVAHLAISLGFDVAVVAMYPREDGIAARQICDEIRRRLPKDASLHVALSSSDPDAIERLILRSSLVVGERLHALILAFRCGTPLVGVGHDPKILSFMRDIRKGSCYLRDFCPRTLAIAAQNAMGSPYDSHLTKEMAARARLDADLAYRLIHRE